MERTLENIQHCNDLARRFLSIRRERPIDKVDVDLCLDALTDTLVKACSKPEVASIIVDAIMDGEERWPSVGTIRRYMRELQYVEVDKREAEDRRHREEQARRKEELAGRGKPCSPEVGRRIDRIVMGVPSQEYRESFIRELGECGDSEILTQDVLAKYECLIPMKSPTP
jgi:hypothetical protein